MSLEYDYRDDGAAEMPLSKDELHSLFVTVATSDQPQANQALTQINHFIGSAQGWNPNNYSEGYFTPTYLTDSGMDFEDAIQCATDLERTRLFVQGVYANVTRKLSQDTGGPIVIVEAGPGTGILLLAAVLFGEGQIQAIGLEINAQTKQKIDQLIEKADLSNAISIIQSDATTHEFSRTSFIDLFISENLHTGGFNEPQDQIIANLRKYMKTDCTLIPEAIELSMQLAHSSYWETTDETEVEADKVADTITVFTRPHVYSRIHYSQDVHEVDATQVMTNDSDAHAMVNTLILSMSVFVGKNHRNEDIVLIPGMARFLGVPHLVRLKAENEFLFHDAKKSVTIAYTLGGSPNDMQITINDSNE